MQGLSPITKIRFHKNFSLVVKFVVVRTILIMLSHNNKWHIQKIDLNNAFFNGIHKEKVYI